MEEDRDVHQALWNVASTLSPRREHDDDPSITTLPFYEHVPPDQALKRLFNWFHTQRNSSEKDGIGLEEFNRLRLAMGQEEISKDEWTRALRTMNKDELSFVQEKEFKELFGPPPFFGLTTNAHHLPQQIAMIQEIAKMEEFIHFIKMLFEKFATNKEHMTLSNVHVIQAQASTKSKIDQETWDNLCRQVKATTKAMTWMQFARAWHINLNPSKRGATQNFFYPYTHPSEVIQAIVANEKVQRHFGDDNVISRKTLSSLLGVTKKKKQMTDKEWCELLETMQTEDYPLQKDSGQHSQRRIKDTVTYAKPHDTVIHTANNLMMYEVGFDDVGAIGIKVQSDFFGQVMTIQSIDDASQAKKHPLIQLNDIVACIDGQMLLHEPATSVQDEMARSNRAQQLLDNHEKEKRVVFVRQEVHYTTLENNQGIQVFLQTYSAIAKGSSFQVHLPKEIMTVNGKKKLRIEADAHLQAELLPEASFEPTSGIITVTFTGAKGLKAHSYLTLAIYEVDCGGKLLAGPGDITHVDGETEIHLHVDWKDWERIVKDAFITRKQRTGSSRYQDESLKPITLSIVRDDCGLTFTPDFFGQVAVVKEISQVKTMTPKILPNDVLSCIGYTDEKGNRVRKSMIKPFALSSSEASKHFKFIKSELKKLADAKTPYTLQFLRLNSHYITQGDRTTFTFNALTALSKGAILTIEMPNSDWRAHDFDKVQVAFLQPENIALTRVHWNATNHFFELTLGECSVEENTQLVVDLIGVTGPAKKTAGPSEVTMLLPNQLKFELHEHWHSFLGGWGGIANDKLVDALRGLETSPLDLWTVLEYSHLLFQMYRNQASELVKLKDANSLRAAVFGSGNELTVDTWTKICRAIGAKPRHGLDEKQFTCSLLELLNGDRSRNLVDGAALKRIYVHLHSVEKLFEQALELFELGNHGTLGIESMQALNKAAFAHMPWKKFHEKFRVHHTLNLHDEWTYEEFTKGFSMAANDGMNPVEGWIKLHYASLLFDEFARLSEMQMEHWKAMLKARKSHVILDDDKWEALCNSVVGDHITSTRGLTKGGFVQAYHSKVLGVREAIVDWNYIQAYTVEPEAHQHRSEALEAEIKIGPASINVNDIMSKALEDVISTDDIAEEAIKLNIDFKRTDVVEERVKVLKHRALTTTFASTLATRDKGFLRVQVKSVSEVAEDADGNYEENALEQYYVVMYTITSEEWQNEFKASSKSWWKKWTEDGLKTIKEKGLEFVRGRREAAYKCQEHEVWDEGKTQKVVAMYEALEVMYLNQPDEKELTQLSEQLNPYKSEEPFSSIHLKSKRMISRKVNKDPTSAGIIRFPNDKFLLFIDQTHEYQNQSHLVVKLFKSTSVDSKFDQKAYENMVHKSIELARKEKSERVLTSLLEKQKHHLKLRIYTNKGMLNDAIQHELSKLKRKENDLNELRHSIHQLDAEVKELQKTQKAWQSSCEAEKEKIKLVGQTALPLDQLLDVLYEDSLDVEDLTLLFDTHRHASCKMLLQFQYQCQFVGRENPLRDLVAVGEKPINFGLEKFDFPAQSPLKITWETSDEVAVAKGDLLYLVRDNELGKPQLDTPYFIYYWKDDDGGRWDCFASSLKLFSNMQQDILLTLPALADSKQRNGHLYLPSSRKLALPPGTYRLVMIRNEEHDGKKYRTQLDQSPPLNVFVGVNSVHTTFGTTPFVDVKTVKVSMAIECDIHTIVSSLPATKCSEKWLKASGYDIELENDILVMHEEIDRVDQALQVLGNARKHEAAIAILEKERNSYKDRLEALKSLKEQGIGVIEAQIESIMKEIADLTTYIESSSPSDENDIQLKSAQSMLEEKQDELSGLKLVAEQYKARHSKVKAHHVVAHTIEAKPLTYSCQMRLHYLLEGETQEMKELTGDKIIVLPQAVVETADKLRVKILGKMQSMNVERSNHIRRQIQTELRILLAIVGILNSPWYIRMWIFWRQWPHYKELYKLDWLYVFEEVLTEFLKADNDLKLLFPLIVQELVDELQSRSQELDLKGMEKHVQQVLSLREVPVNQFEKVDGEHPGLDGHLDKSVSRFVGLADDWNSWKNALRRLFGFEPGLGGVYIAKYVRRQGSPLGELGRVGPFTIEKDASQSKFWDYVPSPERRLMFVEWLFHVFVAALKYLVALLNLSFNVNFVANLAAATKWFDVPTINLENMKRECEQALASVLSFVSVIIEQFNYLFGSILAFIMTNFNFFAQFQGCGQGYGSVAIWLLLWLTTLFLYIVIQEDVLAKVQKLSYYLPFEVGRAGEDRLEQLGIVLVSPVLLVIKVLILFIAKQWDAYRIQMNKGLLFTVNSTNIHGEECLLGGFNLACQIVASILLGCFFYIFLPLLVLDIFSWVPPFDLAKDEERIAKSESRNLVHMKAAIDNNVNLIDPPRSWQTKRCFPMSFFWFVGKGKRYFRDYKRYDFYKLTVKYGFICVWFLILYVYTILMCQAVLRALGGLVGWRGRRDYMYTKPHLKPYGSSWMDKVCCCFNWKWKGTWAMEKIIQPCVSCIFISFGWWTKGRWKIYDIEERAKNCYPMEPDNEVKQLQMMSLHGKINSLVWLPFPTLGILAYVSDVLNRGPIFSYFLNRLFLQADKPENERDPDIEWKVVPRVACQGKVPALSYKDNVVYLIPNTSFWSTFLKWTSSVTELVMVLWLIAEPLISPNTTTTATLQWKATVALISTAIAPLMELDAQMLKSYKKFVEFKAASMDQVNAAKKKLQDEAMNMADSLEKQFKETASKELGLKDVTRPNQDSSQDPRTDSMQDSQDGNDGDDEDDDDEGDGNTKDLIVLSAMPENSYVIQSDQLDHGEGVITVNWRVNASKRFHSFDAIGMFPVRKLEDSLAKRTMDECVCYRLVSELDVEEFGWHPRTNKNGNVISNGPLHTTKMLKHAHDLHKIADERIGKLSRQSILSLSQEELVEKQQQDDDQMATNDGDQIDLTHAAFILDKELTSNNVEPYGKRIHEIILDEIKEGNETFNLSKHERLATTSTKESRDTRMVSGQVKFRPANSNEHEDHPNHDDYVVGNGAGIYPCKYGLERYEFFYLKFTGSQLHKEMIHSFEVVVDANDEKEQKVSDSLKKNFLPKSLRGAKKPKKKDDKKDDDTEGPPDTIKEDYEPLSKFTSNKVSIGTFDLFIRLTSDAPIVWANQPVNLSWEIFGINYRNLSHHKNKNCIAFFRVKDIHNTRECTKVDIVPPSAFIEPNGNGPVAGRLLVRTPKQPGMYEIRFLINYCQEAKLHRRCQVFGFLEEQMQIQRINYLFQRRDLTRSLGMLQHTEPGVWKDALIYTFAWLRPILNHLLVKPSEHEDNPAKFATATIKEMGLLSKKLAATDNFQLQLCLERLLVPLQSARFLDFFAGAFQGSEEMKTHARAIAFVSPSDVTKDAYVKEKKENMACWNVQIDDSVWVLYDDDVLLKYGPEQFDTMALAFLDRPLGGGRFDLLDELLLDNQPMLKTTKLVVESVATACCSQYEPAIDNAVESFMKKAKQMQKLGLFKDLSASLKDECRNHIQMLIRAHFETHMLTGDRFVGWDEMIKKDSINAQQVGLDVLQHRALRHWIKPKLVRGIVKTLQRRYAELTSTNVAILKQLGTSAIHCTCFKSMEYPYNDRALIPLPARTGKSIIHCLNEAIAIEKEKKAAIAPN